MNKFKISAQHAFACAIFTALEEAAFGTVSAIAFCMEFGRSSVEDVRDAPLASVIEGSGIGVHKFHVQRLDPTQWLRWEMQRHRACLELLISEDDPAKEVTILMLRQEGAASQPSILSAAQISALRLGEDVCAV
ncbi:hypothetical protein [Lysobacter sp. CA199]|uniref:hypothetical protein n=1 Tax=Lysobacter sp. CA199 TaxID=3455608 RepID=UPI003F8D4F24